MSENPSLSSTTNSTVAEHPIAKLRRTGEWDRMSEEARLAFEVGSGATLLWVLGVLRNLDALASGVRA